MDDAQGPSLWGEPLRRRVPDHTTMRRCQPVLSRNSWPGLMAARAHDVDWRVRDLRRGIRGVACFRDHARRTSPPSAVPFVPVRHRCSSRPVASADHGSCTHPGRRVVIRGETTVGDGTLRCQAQRSFDTAWKHLLSRVARPEPDLATRMVARGSRVTVRAEPDTPIRLVCASVAARWASVAHRRGTASVNAGAGSPDAIRVRSTPSLVHSAHGAGGAEPNVVLMGNVRSLVPADVSQAHGAGRPMDVCPVRRSVSIHTLSVHGPSPTERIPSQRAGIAHIVRLSPASCVPERIAGRPPQGRCWMVRGACSFIRR